MYDSSHCLFAYIGRCTPYLLQQVTSQLFFSECRLLNATVSVVLSPAAQLGVHTANSFMTEPNWHGLQELERAEGEAQSAAALSNYQANTDADEVDLQLILLLLQRLCQDPGFCLRGNSSALGAILVFLPGAPAPWQPDALQAGFHRPSCAHSPATMC